MTMISYNVEKHMQYIQEKLQFLRDTVGVDYEDISSTNVELWKAAIKNNLSGKECTEALIILRRISYAKHAIATYVEQTV